MTNQNRSFTRKQPRNRHLVLCLALLGTHVGQAIADDGQLLVTNNASLTTMQMSSNTPVQGVRPNVLHRGVNLDGSTRAGSAFGWSLNANSIGGGTVGGRTLNQVDLATGSPMVSAIDLSLPAKQAWVVGRSFSMAQSTGSHLDSDGYQGRNWFQMSQPELVFEDEAADADDLVYLVYGSDRYIEFRRVALSGGGYSTTEFRAVNGAAGVLSLSRDSSTDADTWTYHDQSGNTAVFFGFDADSAGLLPDARGAAGQLWKVIDPGGNTAYVGDSTSKSTAVLSGYDSSGRILYAYDSADRRYSYTYSTIDSMTRLTEVKAETKAGGTWASPTGLSEVGKVAYGYYQTGDTTYGDSGNLELVAVTTPLSDSGVSLERKTYYRYWTGSFDATTNPGHSYALQYIVEAEGYRQADWADGDLSDDDPQSMSETLLKPYASSYFEYDSAHRVDNGWFNGECGCSGAANGVYEFAYQTDDNYSDTSGYQSDWAHRTVVERPDGTYITQYFDEVGQPLSNVVTASDPSSGSPDTWATKVVRDSMGLVTHVHTPANENGYAHDDGSGPDGTITSHATDGLISYFPRESSGDQIGLLEGRRWKVGTNTTDENSTWSSSITRELMTQTIDDATLNKAYPEFRRSYFTATTSKGTLNSANATKSTPTANVGSPLVTEFLERTQVAVGTGENGSGTANTIGSYSNDDGTLAFTKSATGIIGYRAYNSFGLVETSVADADTSKTSSGEVFNGVTIPSGTIDFNKRGTPLHHVTETVYDAQGRLDEVTAPDGDVSKRYYTKLADGRMVTISIPLVDGSTFYGPASYSVTNLAGKAEFSGTIALSTTTTALTSWIDETKDDPLEALGVGSLSGVSVSVYNETGGTLDERRMYFDLPGSPNYLPGSEGTHYDATFYGYDDMGRRWRVEDPTGTVTRTVFDNLGRSTESWIGTNDSSFSGGDTGGTDTMVKTSVTEYDSGNDGGNSLVTSTTLDPDGDWTGTSDQRVTEYLHDDRGRTIVTVGPQTPYRLVKYDEQGQVLASATYSDSAGLDATDDPETLATERLSLSAMVYDATGRSYETRQYQINQSTGAIEQESSNDVYLRTQTWYDPEGRVMKTEGQSTSKTRYDRLGRATHQWTLANDNDTQYEDASATTAIWDSDDYQTSVANDKVATERRTYYEDNSSRVIMTVSVERDHDDYGLGQSAGELDSNADGVDLTITAANLSGRAQITSMWHDDLGRVTDTVRYGTNGGSNYNRATDTSPPARSDTALRTTVTYNDDGTRLQAEDPAGTKTRWEYDDARRVVATISNYVDGTPSSATGDDDNYVRQEYTDGMQTKLWVDLNGDDVEDADDQVTTYSHGVNKGITAGLSRLEVGNVLGSVTYPDSSTVSYAYDALGQQIYVQDAAGTVIETDYDSAGRQTHRRATTTGPGIDTAVLRISTAYTNRGQVETVTQYDNATVGSGNVVDEVKYTYDEWGQVTNFEQDWNSEVGASGSVDDTEVGYTYDLARSEGSGVYLALRGTGMTLPDGTSVSYIYDSFNGRYDDQLSRVSRVQVGSTYVARYEYAGVATLRGTELLEADLLYTRYNTSGTVDRLDNFNRVTDDIWTRGIDTDSNGTYDVYRDFYDTDITWSRSSNIDLVEDNVYPNWDVAYTNDGLERLTQAERGVWGGSSITTTVHDERWTLGQTGNWEQYQLDLDGDGLFTGTNELDDHQTFNTVNELTARDTDDDGTDDYTLTYDAAGNLTDDGKDYEYVYDAFGRLRKVNNQSSTLVAEYTYNGLGHRTGWHYDVDGDGTVEANTAGNSDDPWFHWAHDTRWRQAATYRTLHYHASGGWTIDSDPKEQFVYHNAGLAGPGGSSYIDSVILRDRDANTDWDTASDGTLEERVYYCQNWRADVVGLVSDAGQLIQQVRYDPYGVPFGISKTDIEADGDVDSNDTTSWNTHYTGGTHPLADWNWDGSVDTSDIIAYLNSQSADTALGRGAPSYAYSATGGANRKAYAGYEIVPVLTGSEGWESVYHVRNRVLLSQLGRWTKRDPLGYVDGMRLYGYLVSAILAGSDPMGLAPGDPPVIWPHARDPWIPDSPRKRKAPPPNPGRDPISDPPSHQCDPPSDDCNPGDPTAVPPPDDGGDGSDHGPPTDGGYRHQFVVPRNDLINGGLNQQGNPCAWSLGPPGLEWGVVSVSIVPIPGTECQDCDGPAWQLIGPQFDGGGGFWGIDTQSFGLTTWREDLPPDDCAVDDCRCARFCARWNGRINVTFAGSLFWGNIASYNVSCTVCLECRLL